MQKTILLFVLLLSLSGCADLFPGVHKIDIDQGNLVTQDMVDQLRPGLSKDQVRYVMGSPMLIDTFDQDRWDYLMTREDEGKPFEKKRISLFFVDGKLNHFTGDYRPSGAKIQP